MDRGVSDLLIVTISVAIICATVLVGRWLGLRSRRDLAGERPGLPEHLQGELDDLRADLDGQIEALHQRLDFAERMLARHEAMRPLTPGEPGSGEASR